MLRKSWIATISLLVPVAAVAQTHWPKECRPDIARHCRALAKGDDRLILRCLMDKDDELRRACHKLLRSYGHLPK